MPTTGVLVDRVKHLLRDPAADADSPAWLRAECVTQLDDSLAQLARAGLWGVVFPVQAVADRSFYPLNEQAQYLTSGRATSGSVTTLVDSAADFVTAGVAVNDRVRNLTDGSKGTITTVATTTLTCSAGFSEGFDNTPAALDRYVIERPLTASTIVSIDTVLYDGRELRYATEELLDRRRGSGWELTKREPEYWSVDNVLNPTVLRIIPAPRATGDATVTLPPAPFYMDWRRNITVFAREHPQNLEAEDVTVLVPDIWQDVLVYDAVSALSGEEGEHMEPAVSATTRELARLWRQQLGAS